MKSENNYTIRCAFKLHLYNYPLIYCEKMESEFGKTDHKTTNQEK